MSNLHNLIKRCFSKTLKLYHFGFGKLYKACNNKIVKIILDIYSMIARYNNIYTTKSNTMEVTIYLALCCDPKSYRSTRL